MTTEGKDADKPEPIRRRCLKCGKEFDSKDRKRNWLCPKCNGQNAAASKMDVTRVEDTQPQPRSWDYKRDKR